MKNIHKKISALLLGVFALGANVQIALAHGVLAFETKDVEEYTIVMEATADGPAIYANYPVTYNFRIYEKGTEIEVPYDTSYIFLSKKSGEPLFQTETPAPRDFLPGSQIIAAVPDVGDYEFEIIFNRQEGGEVKTTFDFTSVEGAFGDNINPAISKKSTPGTIPPMYILSGIALFSLGGLIGGITRRKKTPDSTSGLT